MDMLQKPNKGGATKDGFCTSDSGCSDNEKCISGTCTDVCSTNPCPAGETCLTTGNHSYSCVECTTNDQCDQRKICKNNICIDLCSNNPCTNQACSSQNGHTYVCYGCSADAACQNNEFCDTTAQQCKTVCPDACPHQLCEVDGVHKAKCSGCTDDEGCQAGEMCDLQEGSATKNQCVKMTCGNAILAMRDDVAVANSNSTFYEAKRSNKPIILIEESFETTGNVQVISRKVVGPHYFSDIPACKALEKPVLKPSDDKWFQVDWTSELSDFVIGGYRYSSGANNLHIHNMKFDSEFLTSSNGAALKLTGNNEFNKGLSINSPPVDIQGNLTASSFQLKNTDLILDNNVNFTARSIELREGATLTANIPLKFSKDGGYAFIGSDSRLILNADGNGDLSVNVAGILDINGSTSFACQSHCFPIKGEGTVNINAPVSVSGKIHEFHTSTGGSFKVNINSTVTANALDVYYGSHSAAIDLGEDTKLGANAHIKGFPRITYYHFPYEKGAKITVNGVCKQAETSGTNKAFYTYDSPKPPSVFTKDCQ